MANQSFDAYIVNPTNPYFLHSDENPTLIMVSPPLNGKNDHSWFRYMKLAFQSKKKLKFIDRSLIQPPLLHPLHEQWIRCNTMVLSWLQHFVDETIVKSILWIDETADACKYLHDSYSQGDVFRIAQLQEEFYRMTQCDQSISDYFIELKILWKEIENYRAIGHSKCVNPCDCGVIDLLIPKEILNFSPPMKIEAEEVTHLEENVECLRIIPGRQANATTTFPIEIEHGQDGSYHHTDKFFDASKGNQRQTFTDAQVKSILELLDRSKNDASKVNFVISNNLTASNNTALLSPTGNKCVDWLMDTGATDHIAYDLHRFSTQRCISPVMITLPDGSRVSTSICGTVILSESLILFNVLYVPNFHVNLVSVHKLIQSLHCHLTFHLNSCTIVQSTTKKVIGTTSLTQGLFVIDLSHKTHSSVFVSNSSTSLTNEFTLWHLKLDHAPTSLMKTLSSQFPFILVCNRELVPCDICHTSRQRRLPFCNSNTVSNKMFQLLHADI
ncbi:PREDICTED: uncharacterized protein LOC109359789 [Lupinus angustifolius]|uniref:uncharacterized protein LOC109359789 n=1 Tax=Lupinus angustifolius TaxID=3871 RepID=UPI00092E6F40|nr:PREDICTED: uncharacterized protein LOC109359789 [Lupinus angustifolius]